MVRTARGATSFTSSTPIAGTVHPKELGTGGVATDHLVILHATGLYDLVYDHKPRGRMDYFRSSEIPAKYLCRTEMIWWAH